ncbi:CPBP family intramembrane glutamic endopeptidase [Siccirubricoccus phaeus]|uniref:CPBP family intramembrane glutamic endopeptidase n=1 Tax=Siccirubricoccus phaeus TaxID=2595053 RepID=UPI0011F38489|nr:CPBP family intramembrane glutamic endopeptidase [Siccirubricoccus phaeus]
MPLSAATVTGLGAALLGPPAIAALGRAGPPGLGPALLGQAALLLLALFLLLLVLVWEGRGLDSLGFGAPFLTHSLPLGLGLAALFILVVGPLLLRLPAWLGFGGFEAGIARLHRYPRWYLALAACLGGAVEELLYRGFAYTRLAEALPAWLAGLAVVAAFALAHLPLWGTGPALATALSGALLTAAFAWSGDLPALMLAHVTTDLAGLLGRRRA